MMAMSLAVHALADRQDAAESGEATLLADDEVFVDDLVDATVGLLAAPHTRSVTRAGRGPTR